MNPALRAAVMLRLQECLLKELRQLNAKNFPGYTIFFGKMIAAFIRY